MRKVRIAAVAAASLAMVAGASPAMAGTGCNRVINPFVWGCAPWDNNNGPKFPYYTKATKTVAVKKVEQSNGSLFAIGTDGAKYIVAPEDVAKAQKLISQDGGSVISRDGAGIVSHDAGGLRVLTGN